MIGGGGEHLIFFGFQMRKAVAPRPSTYFDHQIKGPYARKYWLCDQEVKYVSLFMASHKI
jgi:hypothetical protein